MNATVQPSHSFRLTGSRFLACLVLAFGLFAPTAQAWLGHGLYFTGNSVFPNSWGAWQDLTPWNTYDGLSGTGQTNDSSFSSGGRTFTRQTFQIRNDSTDVISFDLAVFAGEAWSGGGSVTIQPGATTWVPADVYSDDGTVTEEQVAYNFRRTPAAPPTYTLTTGTTGQGTGTISPGTSTYNAGTSVTVTATPTNGSRFISFDVAVGTSHTTVLSNPITVTMDAAKTVTAYFEPHATDNRPPSVTISGPTSAVTAGSTITLTANAADVDRNLVTVRIAKGATTIASDGPGNGTNLSLSGSDTAGSAGTSVTYTATATDAEGQTATATVTVTVASGSGEPPNSAPSVTLSCATNPVQPGASFTLNATATDADSNLSRITITKSAGTIASTAASGGSGSLSGSDTAGAAGSSVTYTATATDAAGLSGTATFTVTVANSISRHMATNYTPAPVPWQGGLVTIFGDCTVAGTFDVVIYRRTMNGTTEVSRTPVYSTTVGIPVVSGETFLTWTVSQATERGDAGNRYFVAVFTPRDTHLPHSTEFYQKGIPVAQTQTVTISPAMPVGAPGQPVTLTASGGHFGYVWTNESSNDGQPAAGTLTPSSDTATFTVPASASMGDTFVVSAYASAGGPLGSDWAQSEKTYVTITCGSIVENDSFRIGLIARPAVLPYTGGEVEITASIQALYPYSPVYKTWYVSAPGYISISGTPDHSVAPAAPAITKRKVVVPPNLTSTPKQGSAVLQVGAPGVQTLSATAPITIQAIPPNSPPYLALGAVPDIYWDGATVWTNQWRYDLYSPGTAAAVSAAMTMPGGAAYAPPINAWYTTEYPGGSSPYAARTWTVLANTQSAGYGNLSAVPQSPLGEYTLRMTATNAAGTTVAEGKGRVRARASISGAWDYSPVDYRTDPDTGEQTQLYPSDFGWSITGGGSMLGVGDSSTVTVIPGTRYRFVRWRDAAGKTLTESLSVNVIATQRWNTVYAVLEDANLPKITPTITWPTPAAIMYGTALSSTQLNATAMDGGSTVSGTLTYSPAAGAVLEPGTQTLTVQFTPTNTARYNSATASVQVQVQVQKATPQITWPTPAPITYGTALSGTQLNATANVPGIFSYSPASGTVPGAGSCTLTATFTPTDTINYDTASASVNLTVDKALLTVTAHDQSRVYGLENPVLTVWYSGFVNGDTASSLTVQPTATTVATVSTPVSTCPIVPGGGVSSNYQFKYVDGTLTIAKATGLVTLGNLSQTYDGAPKSATATTSPVGLVVNLAYNGSATAPTAVGSYTVVGTIGDTNYQGSATGTLTIHPRHFQLTASSTPAGATFTGAGDYIEGQTATLTVSMPAYILKNWSGDISGTANPVSILMDGNKSVVANMGPAVMVLTVNSNGGGTVSGGGTYTINTWANFSATPDATHRLGGWSGDYTGTGASGTIQMTNNWTVTQTFLSKLAQSITFPNPGPLMASDTPYPLNASATSGLAVTYILISGPAQIVGNGVLVTGAGTITVQAQQAGDSLYLPASPVTISFQGVVPPTTTASGDQTAVKEGSGNTGENVPGHYIKTN